MNKLRIAFCGMNVPLNETLAAHAKDLIYRPELDFASCQNPLPQVLEITRQEDWEGPQMDWLNLWAMSVRRMNLEALRNEDVVISTSCGVDQMALQAMWLAEQIERTQTGIVGPDGQPIVAAEVQIAIARSGATLQVIVNSTEEEVMINDFTYAVLPAGYSPEMQPEAIGMLMQYQDFLKEGPAFAENVTMLPDNEEAAKDALKNEAEKWRQKLAS